MRIRTLAFVPVRGGSQAVPRKNIEPIGGRPLIDWVLTAALNSKSVTDVVVSTDDDEIAEHVANRFDSVAVFRRSEETATATASTESAMLEYAYIAPFALTDRFVLLQATSPLTTAGDIDRAVGLVESGYDSALSVVRQRRFQWTWLDDHAEPVDFDPNNRPRRQNFDGMLIENGAIYCTSFRALLETRCRISGRIGLVEMSGATYHELDEPIDARVIDLLLRDRGEHGLDSVIDLSRIRLVITDIDGCLTDNGMYYGQDGAELKRFSARDGKGFELLRDAGLNTALITSESGALIARRAQKLQADFLVEGSSDKVLDADRIRKELELDWSEIAFLGDDVHDVNLLRMVGVSACPADATASALSVADHHCSIKGGQGAFRELADLIIAAKP